VKLLIKPEGDVTVMVNAPSEAGFAAMIETGNAWGSSVQGTVNCDGVLNVNPEPEIAY
jgi:hypothetical protein